MKKLIIILLLLITTLAWSHDFRNTDWGMSVNQVKKSETFKKTHETKKGNFSIIIYKGEMALRDVAVIYGFVDDKLTKVKCIFDLNHAVYNDFFSDYKSIQEILVSKYGKNYEVYHSWKDDLYQNSEKDWGMAIAMDHLFLENIWMTKKTKIRLAMQGTIDHQIKLYVEYFSLKYLPTWNQGLKKENEKGF